MKKRKVALYDPYLDVLGGGEKHILSILKVFEDEGFELNIFWDRNLQDDFKDKLDLSFKYLITFKPNIFLKNVSFLKKMKILREFEYFFYVTNGSYFFSSAKNNFIFTMVPNKKLYDMTLLNQLKTSNYRFITNSNFTKKKLNEWSVKCDVIYPYIEEKFIQEDFNLEKKEKIILSVGRFFSQLHSKKQESVIKLFKQLKKNNPLFRDFKLVLMGGLKDENKNYFGKLESLAGQDKSIILKPNVSFQELFEQYQKSLIYWHFTGLGVDEEKHPELVEHLGITPLEAMASGCLTFCYNAGGPKELLRDSQNGFLFNSEDELIKKTENVLKNKTLQKKIQNIASKYIKENFSYDIFKEKVKKIVFES